MKMDPKKKPQGKDPMMMALEKMGPPLRMVQTDAKELGYAPKPGEKCSLTMEGMVKSVDADGKIQVEVQKISGHGEESEEPAKPEYVKLATSNSP